MMHRTCDVCGREICKAPFGEFVKTIQKEDKSRNTMMIKTRREDGTVTNYDDVCSECTDGILSYIETRKRCLK